MNAPSKQKSNLIKGATGDWEVVIGLEVHAQVASEAKLFSGASTAFGGEPNSHVSLVDAAMPGMLPVINKECVAQAVRTGHALNSRPNLVSVFDRKNYFYPDLPQGYQISQYKSPVVGEGWVMIDLPDGSVKKVGIERLHLEQDAGKSIHDRHPSMSLVDLNRSGVALMEIVSKPEMHSAYEAMAYVAELRSIMDYIETCDGDMEKGNLRADVNVSVRRPGEPFGTRCEIKNVNSIRFIGQAVEVEARRQIEILEDGGVIEQETRLFDPDRNETPAMRSKEEAHDYRYFPDPDLLPLTLEQTYIDDLRATLRELPRSKRARYISNDGLSPDVAGVLVSEKELAYEYEHWRSLVPSVSPKALANWLINQHMGRLNKEGMTLKMSPISAQANTAIVALTAKDVISGKGAKDLYERIWLANTNAPPLSPRIATAADVDALVIQFGLQQVTDASTIEKAVDEIIAANPEKAEQVRTKPGLLGWFMSEMNKKFSGKANPKVVSDLLKAKLGL